MIYHDKRVVIPIPQEYSAAAALNYSNILRQRVYGCVVSYNLADIRIIENTTGLAPEYLVQRLSLIPCEGQASTVECRWVDTTQMLSNEIPGAHQQIVINRSQTPATLHITGRVVSGTVRDHAKFTSVYRVVYDANSHTITLLIRGDQVASKVIQAIR